MPTQVLSKPMLRNALSATYSSRTTPRMSKSLRRENTDAFLAIDRNGLEYNSREHRILLYSTLNGENIHIQMPGLESASSRKKPMPMDFRPKLQYADDAVMDDVSFHHIWKAFEEIAQEDRGKLYFVATLFFRMGYMYEYQQVHGSYACEALAINDGNIRDVVPCEPIDLSWNHINLSEEIWRALNANIGDVRMFDGRGVSFEAFIKYVDLLLQNEDCKYYYINKNNVNYNFENGRTSSCETNLLILHYLSGLSSFSSLLNRFQAARGVPKLNKRDYPAVTDGIVTII